MISIIFGLLASIFWGAGDFFGGLSTRRSNVYVVVLVSEFAGLALILPLPFLFHEPLPATNTLLLCSLAGFLGTLGLLALYYAMATRKMGVAGPVSALLAAAIPVVVSSFTEGFPGAVKAAGFGLALLAIWFISAGDESSGSWRDHLGEIWLPLLAGLGFGFYLVVLHAAGKEGTYWPLVAARSISSLLLAVFVLATRQPLHSLSRARWQPVLAGLCDVIANTFYVLGGQAGRLDIVAVLGSLYPGTTVLLAWVLLKERLNRSQGIGILLALTAIVLITL